MRITDAKSRRKNVTELYIDGEAAVKLSSEVWEKCGLQVGNEIEEDMLQTLLEESQLCKARERALNLLTYRAHSRQELEQKISRTVSKEAAKEAVNKMEEWGLTNDARYAQEYAGVLIGRKGYAPRRALYELSLKGIDRETAQAAVESIEVDITENIRRIIQKKYAGIEDEKIRNRAVRALQRLGYNTGQIREALQDWENTD